MGCGNNSTAPTDCFGISNGLAIIDDCDHCVSGTTNLSFNFLKDDCGVCNGDNSTCVDCAGAPNGSAVGDDCGVCDSDTANDNTTCSQDCADVWGGSSELDCAGVCDGTTTTYDLRIINNTTNSADYTDLDEFTCTGNGEINWEISDGINTTTYIQDEETHTFNDIVCSNQELYVYIEILFTNNSLFEQNIQLVPNSNIEIILTGNTNPELQVPCGEIDVTIDTY